MVGCLNHETAFHVSEFNFVWPWTQDLRKVDFVDFPLLSPEGLCRFGSRPLVRSA